MSAIRRYLPTHLVALAIGLAFGFSQGKQVSSEKGAVRQVVTPSVAKREGVASGSANVKAARKDPIPSSAAYAAAWETIEELPLADDERYSLENALMDEWCDVDLEAALQAWIRCHMCFSDFPFRESGLDLGLHVEIEDLDALWKLVSQRRFGVETIAVRKEWMIAMALREPLRLVKMLDELPDEARGPAIQCALCAGCFGEVVEIAHPQVVATLVSKAVTEDNSDFSAFLIKTFAAQARDHVIIEELNVRSEPLARHILTEALIAMPDWSGDLAARKAVLANLPTE